MDSLGGRSSEDWREPELVSLRGTSAIDRLSRYWRSACPDRIANPPWQSRSAHEVCFAPRLGSSLAWSSAALTEGSGAPSTSRCTSCSWWWASCIACACAPIIDERTRTSDSVAARSRRATPYRPNPCIRATPLERVKGMLCSAAKVKRRGPPRLNVRTWKKQKSSRTLRSPTDRGRKQESSVR